LNDSLRVSIVGASRYSGLELTKLLLRHRAVHIERLFANTSAGRKVADVYPWLAGQIDQVYDEYSPDTACMSDLVFVALPSGEAMNLVPEFFGEGKKSLILAATSGSGMPPPMNDTITGPIKRPTFLPPPSMDCRNGIRGKSERPLSSQTRAAT
jgi:hypothetical protein